MGNEKLVKTALMPCSKVTPEHKKSILRMTSCKLKPSCPPSHLVKLSLPDILIMRYFIMEISFNYQLPKYYISELNRDFNAYAIDLNDNRTHEITFAVIDSHNLWRWTLNYCHPYLNHDCSIPEESIRVK